MNPGKIVRIYAPRFFGVGLSSGTIRSASARRFTAGAGGIANHELRHNHYVARGQVWFCLAFEHCVASQKLNLKFRKGDTMETVESIYDLAAAALVFFIVWRFF